MRFVKLTDWLAWQETQHAKQIDLGLERARPVLQRMGLARPTHGVITVAGTNGKGSSVAFLEAVLLAAGYRVGAYMSPHLLRYNERVRLNGVEVDDATFCESFARIDAARGDISLTYFEFGTLAAFDIFQRAAVDIAVLEVGMGGRLDATNLLDADVALVTAIGIDHTAYLGPDRESIAREKAGIFRRGRPAVCGDPDPPRSLIAHAQSLGAPLYRLGHDFGYEGAHGDGTWSWWGRQGGVTQRFDTLPRPRLYGAFQLQNAAGAVMALQQCAARFPVSEQALREGLQTAQVRGRFQIVPGAVTCIFDVAHNPHGAEVLAATLREHACAGRTLAVCAMLADKDSAGVLHALRDSVDSWYVAGLAAPRGARAEQLAAVLSTAGAAVTAHNNVADACRAALRDARPGDRVVAFGSFYTVAEAWPALQAAHG